MANKKGTCTNCERPDLNIANAKGHCHTCYAAGKDLEGEDLLAALLEVKERVNDPEYHRVGKRIETLTIPPEKNESMTRSYRSHRFGPCTACGKQAPIKAQGMCNSCHYEKVEKPKKEAKIAGKTVPIKVMTKGISPPPDHEHSEKSTALLTLAFQDETGMSIFNHIESEAKRCRRTPDQQALFMLQSHLPGSRGISQGSEIIL